MHAAVESVLMCGQSPRVFPVENKKKPNVEPVAEFFNPLVKENAEQRTAVEHILAATSGTAPYLIHGPPGTGKTVTIVEAILQLVSKDKRNQILVCTDSNMAADHVASMLIKYADKFDKYNFLLRANSRHRPWETMPLCLVNHSNGCNRNNYRTVDIADFLSYKIVVITLVHAAKFVKDFRSQGVEAPITHLFIDEAAQSSEPAALIPVCGLLKLSGLLVLSGDPQQLGPVIISHKVRQAGLGTSLMERLRQNSTLYSDQRYNANYIVMLKNNFRSDEDILKLPNDMFYGGQIKAFAQADPISTVDILGERSQSRSIVFHGVLSEEKREGKSPSYYNPMELDLVTKYVSAFTSKHKVALDDIGIVTPYIRQAYKIRQWLQKNNQNIEVGTVEAFQGKEKRVILISTVRANYSLLEHDNKFQLGFLVDDKRFNVAVTRAKAKIIIIGNPLCLEIDIKWRAYMDRCRMLGTYHGFDPEAVENGLVADVENLNINANDAK